jgi:hypothetical protein
MLLFSTVADAAQPPPAHARRLRRLARPYGR